MKLRVAGLLLMLLPCLSAAALPDLHAAMLAHLESQQLQGAVWSTLAADGRIAVDAAGVKDARSGEPLRPDHRVQVGSIAKPLLAVGVLRLVGEGRLALDAPVTQVLPAIAFDNPWAATDPVRVRHLLDHTAGLDDARLGQIFSLRPGADTPLAQAFAGGLPLRVRSRPGSRHSYSNSGYTLLGMAIEAVTGERYESHLTARVLQPLGMRDSSLGFVTQADDARLAMGHFEAGATQAAVPTYLRPAMQLTTTAADMVRFARFLMSDGRVDGVQMVETELLQAMGRPFGTEAAAAGLQVGYGLGMGTRDRHGAVGRCHGGSTVGFRAMLCAFPDSQRAFFVAVNADIEGADYNRFDALLVEALQLPAVEAAPVAPPPDDAAAWTGFYVPSPNRFARFAWLDTTLGFVRVQREDSVALRLAPFQGAAVSLLPVSAGLHRASDRRLASHAFLRAADGSRVLSTGLQSYEQKSLAILLPLWLGLAAGLLGAVWLSSAGLVRLLVQRRAALAQPGVVAFFGIAVLALPLPFFLSQSFLALGDITLASVLLALATLLLPIGMLAGLVLARRRRPRSLVAKLDVAAMLALLQLSAVLAAWGLLPLRLWA